MITYFAFLRGINVGGHNKIPMQNLRRLLENLGFKEVQTYIQTGNVIFKSLETSLQVLTLKIEQSILEHFGFVIPVLLKTERQLKEILERCPFNNEEKQSSYFALLYSKINETQKASVLGYDFPNEKFNLTNDCVYLYSSIGYGKSKANNNFFEKKLKVVATTRNFKTLNKLLALTS
ncbi:DUF1697 domain-containing protein [Olleya sp. HaHaR_3_96]|uniref:DUF1697 domain-containing protein n=1 Tax=Olleya sp. HaHaR_3_96 TaxID=2745560 RepID=UPI001C4F1F72|nr:DUF1697 domain-containing protein [Olleya sp. HaHaR_3_96]QXP61242.1 DUF1697 domain-containing protein [Olleya sp. HaHaR_3_96]